MELLSSVHWVIRHHEPPAMSLEEAISAVQNWNERKAKMFQVKHIKTAYTRLVERGVTPIA